MRRAGKGVRHHGIKPMRKKSALSSPTSTVWMAGRAINPMLEAEKAVGLQAGADDGDVTFDADMFVTEHGEQYLCIERPYTTLGGADCDLFHAVHFFTTEEAARRALERDRAMYLETSGTFREVRLDATREVQPDATREVQPDATREVRPDATDAILAQVSVALACEGFGETLITSRGPPPTDETTDTQTSSAVIIVFRVASAVYKVRFSSATPHPMRTAAADMALAAAMRLVVERRVHNKSSSTVAKKPAAANAPA